MKKLLLLLITFFPFIHGYCPNLSFRVNSTTITKDSKDLLIEAISYKESRHNVKAVNMHEQAYGFLQVREGVVKDVNRVFGTTYTVTDALDSIKAVKMFVLYQSIYNKEFSLEKAARIWNGGPKGYLKPNTLPYWKDVHNYLSSMSKVYTRVTIEKI